MKKEIKFSIIIPVYNVAPYLGKCIDSILKQNYKGYEVLLIDDGSTDESGSICDDYEEMDRRVRVVHQMNCGLSAARNRGIEDAQGEYIIFLDSDDYWHDEDVLNKINVRLDISRAEVLSFNYVKFTGELFEPPYFGKTNNMPLETQKAETLKYQVKNDLWIACAWNKAVKKELFNDGNLRFNIGITSEDIDWCLRLAFQAESFDFISDVVVCYRQRLTSISKSITVEKIDTLIDNIDTCLDIMKRENNFEKAQLLKSYVSYQYGTVVYLVSTVTEEEEYNKLLNRLYKKNYILKWSKNRKIRMIQIINSIGGFKLVMFMLRLRERMR